MEYASSIGHPHCKKDSDALERVQRRAAHWIKNKHDRATSVTALLNQLHLESLEDCRRISRLIFLFKILNEIRIWNFYVTDLSEELLPNRDSKSYAA